MRKILLLCVLIVSAHVISAQSFSKDEVDIKLKSLSEKEKVEYVVKNFYKIYSADFDNAKKLARMAVDLARQNHWKDQEGYALVCLGVVSFLKGNYTEALPHYNRALDIFDSLKNLDGLASAHNEIAVFFSKNKDNKRAYEHLEASLKASAASGNLDMQGTSYGHLATLKEREGKIKEATTMYRKVYEIRLQQKDSVGLGYALLDLAAGKQREGDLEGALHYIRQSTNIRERVGDKQGLAVNLVNTGEVYMAFHRYDDAIHSFNACIEAGKKIGYTDLIRYCYDQLAQAYLEKNDYKSAYHSRVNEKAFNDSLFNVDRTKILAEMQSKYEADKKQQHIELQESKLAEQHAELQRNLVIIIALAVTLALLFLLVVLIRKNAVRKQAQLLQEHELALRDGLIKASLESQEVERKRFAQDLHDGMGQLISSLRLSVSGINKASSTEERVDIFDRSEKILKEMHAEIRGIAFNLMPQTLIQHGLAPALEEMSRRVNESGKVVVKVSTFELPARFAEVMEISLYRIIQEWLNNVMKYADATVIEIQLVGYENEVSVVIEDNGKGFDPFVLEEGKGHGWRNIKTRLNLIKATMEIDSSAGRKGTTLMFHVPYQNSEEAQEKAMGEIVNTQ